MSARFRARDAGGDGRRAARDGLRATRDWLRGVAPRAILRRLRPTSIPVPGRVDFGDLRRTRPISRHFGFERGLPVDRYYIERFLAAHADDIQGRVLEVGDASYTRRFGGSKVLWSDVLDAAEGNPDATIVADLAAADQLPSGAFDCVILTQTLQFIYDLRAAIATLYRILAPGGVLLATVPGISQIELGPWREAWCWEFTERSIGLLFGDDFPSGEVTIQVHGNVLAAVALLEGIAAPELRPEELAALDSSYPVCITIRAVKPTAGGRQGSPR